MPMLHNCGFASCSTLTLSTYCWEHEVFIRRELEAERLQASARSRRLAGELAVLEDRLTAPSTARFSADRSPEGS
jgi:hypothetical protein